ncbi:hypothetical protein WH96_19285 [Kiloniella spongiae]|uniref:Chemotaxis protein n=1 Tax=Kiloniella spongiae TaxID=1489064 RepID=A0A0H2MR49_9PROT|nr:hypothetical protein WH96_19285 [Kiloniella spongiae]
MAVLALLMAYLLYQKAQEEISSSYESKYLSYLLADEMRQSSDDLTRLARTYSVTGEAKYEEQYFRILDIRNGKINRPEDYYRIYWDLYTLNQQKPRPDSSIQKPLNTLMHEAGFTEEEFELLKKAGENSDGLVQLEVEAMNAVKGKFKDTSGEYTVSGVPNLQLAAKLTHSEDYHRFKSDIVKPIDDFYILLEQRTNNRINDAEASSSLYGIIVLIMLGFVLIMAGLTGWIFQIQIVKPVVGIKNAMLELSSGNLQFQITGTEQTNEIGDIASTLQIFKDNMIESKRLMKEQTDAEASKLERAEEVSGFIQDFRSQVEELVNLVVDVAMRIDNAASASGNETTKTGNRSFEVALAAERTSSNVDSTAAAAEELSASVSQISEQIAQSSTIVESAVIEVDQATNMVRGLERESQKISEVSEMISAIAEQTNLLALNATIEAARAGDAGKGFAVVASEVKNLATQTAKATEQISSMISNIQGATGESVTAIERIGSVINNINSTTSVIASAIDEQNSVTQEIARTASTVSTDANLVLDSVGTLTLSAARGSKQSVQMVWEAKSLDETMKIFKAEIENFLERVS